MNRRGLTLVEVILVLCLLVVIGALSVPLLDGAFARSRLHHGSDLLRAAWTRARLAATQTGQAHVFRYVPRGSVYQIMPLAGLSDPAAAPAAPSSAEPDEIDLLRLPENRLPKGVLFTAGKVSTAPQIEAGATSDGSWSTPILFHPDGTTSDAVVILANEQGLQLRVTLRGLTGVSRVSDVGSEAAR